MILTFSQISFFILLFIGFLISFVITNKTLDYVDIFSRKLGILDYPNTRKIHSKPISRLGGSSMVVGLYCAFFLVKFIDQRFYNFNLNYQLFDLIILPLIFFFLIGLADDIFKLSPFTRLIFQLGTSSIAWINGLRIQNLDISFIQTDINYLILPEYLSFLCTILW